MCELLHITGELYCGAARVSRTPRDQFVDDSALEGAGFELSVPREIGVVSKLCRLSADLSCGELRAPISEVGCSTTDRPPHPVDCIHTFEHSPSQASPALLTQLGLRSGGGSACPSSTGFSIDGCNVCEARISPRFFMKQIASLTVTRTRCSTFGHGPGLRRQERRATVGLGQA